MSDKFKPLLCRRKHVIGEVHWNGNGVPQVYVYHQAVRGISGSMVGSSLAMVGPVTGQVRITCSFPMCGEVRTWGASAGVVRYLAVMLGKAESRGERMDNG